MSDVIKFDGFEPANTTAVPDVLFDELLPILNGAELKVMLYIIRRTLGFKKTTDTISFGQFLNGITTKDGRVLDKGCGVKDRTTLSKALAHLEKLNCIESSKSKNAKNVNEVTAYAVKFRSQVVGKTYQGSRENLPPVVGKTYQGSREIPQGVVGKSYPQETVIQQTDQQETVIQESVPASSSQPPLSQDAIALATPSPVFVPEEKEKERPTITPSQPVTSDEIPPASSVASNEKEQPAALVQHGKVTQASPPARAAHKPKVATDEDAALVARCQAIQAKINELRGFALKRAGLIIDERKVIRDHLAKENFTDERIERIHAWITTNIWKYKSVGGRGDVGARVIWEESGRAEALTVAPLASRPERPRYNEHGVDMSQYSLSALFAQQQQRQEVGQA